MGVRDMLPLWLDCPAPRTLLSIAVDMLSRVKKDAKKTERCITIMLDTRFVG